MKIVTEQVGF